MTIKTWHLGLLVVLANVGAIWFTTVMLSAAKTELLLELLSLGFSS